MIAVIAIVNIVATDIAARVTDQGARKPPIVSLRWNPDDAIEGHAVIELPGLGLLLHCFLICLDSGSRLHFQTSSDFSTRRYTFWIHLREPKLEERNS